MDSRTAIKASIDIGKMISMAYLEDLTDDEMMHRPHPKCNHIKWQVGHLVQSEHDMIEGCVPGSMPALPDGFVEKYTKETANNDDAGFFHSKAELIQAFEQQREGTLAALDKLSDEQLENPAPEEMQAYAPNWAAAFAMQDSHWLMHAGQWAIIRRQLGRPPLF